MVLLFRKKVVALKNKIAPTALVTAMSNITKVFRYVICGIVLISLLQMYVNNRAHIFSVDEIQKIGRKYVGEELFSKTTGKCRPSPV